MSFVLVAAAALHASVLAAPPEVTFLPTGTAAYKVSNDGSVVVGPAGSGKVFRWTSDGSYTVLSGVHTGNPQVSISGDGLTVVTDTPNAANKMVASTWVNRGPWTQLPTTGFASCDAFFLNAYDANLDGSVVVGLGWITGCGAHAFRWDPTNGSVDLGSIVAGRSSRANAVSNDGTVIAGWQDTATGQRRGARWVNLAESYLPNYVAPSGTSYVIGEALGMSGNGKHLVGYNVFSAPAGPGWHYDVDANVVYALQNLAQFGSQDALVNGASDDGSVCIGTSGGIPIGRKAIIWLNNGAPQDLVAYIQSKGGSTAPYTSLGTAMDISADGRTIVGWGAGTGNPTGAWIVHFPADCPADLTGDGSIGAEDIAILLGAWGSSGPADLTGDGTVGADDLAVLLGAWGACP